MRQRSNEKVPNTSAGVNAEDRVPPGVGTMSVVRWALVVVTGLVAVFSVAHATGGLAKVSSGAGAAHATLYHCPMHPSIVQDHPGECPICSMTLVPKPEGATRAEPGPRAAAPSSETKAVPGLSVVDLTPDRVQLVGMRTAKVERAALAGSLRALGVVAASGRRVVVLADVFEQDAARLTIGQKATLELAAYPGEKLRGRVQLISPTLSATHTLRVRLELANAGPRAVRLRPGMSADVSLELPSSSGLIIPSEALVDTGEHQYVFVAKGEGHFEPRLVRAGARTGDMVPIAEGVAEGETVVTTGNFLVDSESRLRAAIEGAK